MRIGSLVLSIVVSAFVYSGVATADHHEMQAPAAGITFVLDPGGKPAETVKFAKRAEAIAKSLGTQGKQRMFNVAFGGPTSDHIIIVVEFPNMTALAENSAKMSASPEYQKLAAEIRAAGIRLLSRYFRGAVAPETAPSPRFSPRCRSSFHR
jgi:hypothetical protein